MEPETGFWGLGLYEYGVPCWFGGGYGVSFVGLLELHKALSFTVCNLVVP